MLKMTLSSRQFILTPKSYVFAEIKEKLPAQKTHNVGPLDAAGGPLVARRYVPAGWRPYDSRAIKRRQYFVSKYGSSIYI